MERAADARRNRAAHWRGRPSGRARVRMTHAIETLPVLLIDAHSRCNCRCVMCDIWKTDERREFTLAQLESQMHAIERLQVRWVVFTGGEAFMHSNLFALSERL